ncbi:MAG: hypothetical protein WD602_08765 [Actinomycetota bacterium]
MNKDQDVQQEPQGQDHAGGKHVHGPGCGHSHFEGLTPDMAELEANLVEVAHALQAKFGEAGPTAEQEKEFMKEWLVGKGRTPEEADSIVNS